MIIFTLKDIIAIALFILAIILFGFVFLYIKVYDWIDKIRKRKEKKDDDDKKRTEEIWKGNTSVKRRIHFSFEK